MVVNIKNKKAQNNRRPQLIRYKDEIQIDQYLKKASAIPYKRMQHDPQKENPKKARKPDSWFIIDGGRKRSTSSI